MSRRVIRYGFVVSLSILVGGLGYLFASERWHRSLTADRTGPAIEVPDTIDLGMREPGPSSETFHVHNRGKQPLEMSDIRTGCGCMSITVANSTAAEPLKSLTIDPGTSVELRLRFVTNPRDEPDFRVVIEFETNDPRRPRVGIVCSARYTGQMVASPAAWVIGDLPAAEGRKSRVRLWDNRPNAADARLRVESSNSRLVTARLVPPLHGDDWNGHSPTGVIELDFIAPTTAGTVEERVTLLDDAAGTAVLTLPVSARVNPEVFALPAVVLLPRRAGGTSVDEITLLVKSSHGKTFRLDLVDPSGLQVTFPTDAPDATTTQLSILWPNSLRPKPGVAERREVRLTAHLAGRSVSLTIPVTYRTP